MNIIINSLTGKLKGFDLLSEKARKGWQVIITIVVNVPNVLVLEDVYKEVNTVKMNSIKAIEQELITSHPVVSMDPIIVIVKPTENIFTEQVEV